MYRTERTIAFLIDGFIILILLASIYFLLVLVGPAVRDALPFSTVGRGFSSNVSMLIFLGPTYNMIWIYYLTAGLVSEGSIGKRLLGMKIINRENRLTFFDLAKRYSFLIALGIIYTISGTFIWSNVDTINLDIGVTLQNTYTPLVIFYLIVCNLGRGPSVYDRLAKLDIIKIKQNKTSDQIASSEAAHDLSS